MGYKDWVIEPLVESTDLRGKDNLYNKRCFEEHLPTHY